MPETSYQQLLPKKLRPKPIDLMGQCSRCCDLFTVTAFLVPGTQGEHATISETASLKWVYTHTHEQNSKAHAALVHKCGGKVNIYGHTYAQPEDYPATSGGPASCSLPRYVLPAESRRYISRRAAPASAPL